MEVGERQRFLDDVEAFVRALRTWAKLTEVAERDTWWVTLRGLATRALVACVGLVAGWACSIAWWDTTRLIIVGATVPATALGLAVTYRWKNAFGVAFALAALATGLMGFALMGLSDFN